MLSMTIKEEEILAALRQLDSTRWYEVLDFIGYLHHQAHQATRTANKQPSKIMTASDRLQSGLVSLWAESTLLAYFYGLSARAGRFLRLYLSHSLGVLDALIAHIAVGIDAELATFNLKHYRVVTDLKLLQPYERK